MGGGGRPVQVPHSAARCTMHALHIVHLYAYNRCGGVSIALLISCQVLIPFRDSLKSIAQCIYTFPPQPHTSTSHLSTCSAQSEHGPSPMWIMSLEMDKCKTLQECIAHYFMLEELRAVQGDAANSNQMECRQCHKLRDGTKVLSLDTMPKLLMVRLKRFNAAGQKLCHAIRYPTRLDLDVYVAGYTEVYPEYQLYGVVVHEGSTLQGGHYSVYVKPIDTTAARLHNARRWVHANDAQVRECTDQLAQTQQGVAMLFYRLMGTVRVEDDGKAPRDSVGAMQASRGWVLSPRDLEKLKPGQKLNDEVVNLCLAVLAET